MWLGDIETDFLESVEGEIQFFHVDVAFAPHHGRSSGRLPKTVLDIITPKLIIVGEAPSKDLEYYGNYDTITQNSSGDITFDCDGDKINIYVKNYAYSVSFLKDDSCNNIYGNYVGTLYL